MSRRQASGLPVSIAVSEPEHEDRLMQRAADGDRSAMDDLYQALAKRLYNYLLRISGDAERAEDALQVAFLNAWQGRATFRGRGARPWLFVIARNALQRQVRVAPAPASAGEAVTGPDPADDHSASELADRLDAALLRLPADTREAIILSRVSGLGLDEIADLLDISNVALRVRISRGLASLKEELTP